MARTNITMDRAMDAALPQPASAPNTAGNSPNAVAPATSATPSRASFRESNQTNVIPASIAGTSGQSREIPPSPAASSKFDKASMPKPATQINASDRRGSGLPLNSNLNGRRRKNPDNAATANATPGFDGAASMPSASGSSASDQLPCSRGRIN